MSGLISIIIYMIFAVSVMLFLQERYGKKGFVLIINKGRAGEEKIKIRKEKVFIKKQGGKIKMEYDDNKWRITTEKLKSEEVFPGEEIEIGNGNSITLEEKKSLCFEAGIWLLIASAMLIVIIIVFFHCLKM